MFKLQELKSGILKADRLRDALSEVGLQVNSTILGAVMHRYIRKDGTLRFGDFVAILLNLSIAFGTLFDIIITCSSKYLKCNFVDVTLIT